MRRRDARTDHFHLTVGEAIKARREAAGLKRADVAKALGVHQSTVDRVEEGTTLSAYTLTQIAHVLDCTLDDLVPLDALNPAAA